VDTLDISPDIRIPMSEIILSAVRSQGAGGQNVNKVASAIHLRFDAGNSRSIPDPVKRRLLALPDQRITDSGLIIIKSQAHRSQDRNRQAALNRLTEILKSVLDEPKRRLKTRPGKQARKKRLDDKARRGALKKMRRPVQDD